MGGDLEEAEQGPSQVNIAVGQCPAPCPMLGLSPSVSLSPVLKLSLSSTRWPQELGQMSSLIASATSPLSAGAT